MNILSRKGILYNFLIWSLVAVFTATQLYLKSYQSSPEEANWLGQFGVQLLVWWVWAILTPLIFWLVTQYRIGRGNVVIRSVIHLVASVVLVCLFLAAYSLIWNAVTFGTVRLEMFRNIYIALFLNLFHWHLFIYMAILGIVHAREFYLESKRRELRSIQLEKDLVESQLQMLKMQLQPHFLFNALNSIVSSIHRNKLDSAIHMTTDLSELLRISLAESDLHLVPLQKELEHLKTYLRIESHRFKDLEVSYHIDQSLVEKPIPNFILQPIVENSIKHGISKKQKARRIRISAAQDEGEIVFSVYNEGPELNRQKLDGIGLSNIRKRLHTFYEDKSHFEIRSMDDGVETEIRIPA
ncbi:MAG: histidine kinase [Bacteroidota bacterium]